MKIYYTFFLLLFTFIIISCYKSKEISVDPIDQSITINEAKAWFYKSIKPIKMAGRVNDRILEDRYLNWESAELVKSSEGIDGVLITVNYNSKGANILTFQDEDGKLVKLPLFQQAIIFKDSKGQQKIKLLQLAYLDNNCEIDNLSEFNGYIINTEWDGTPLYVEKWYKGYRQRKLYPLSSGGRTNCVAVDMGYDYSYIDNGVFTIAHHYNWMKVGCNDSDNTSETEGGTGVGGGGGQSGEGESGNVDNEDYNYHPDLKRNKKTIRNNMTRPCFTHVLNAVLANNFTGVVQGMLTDFSSSLTKDLIFEELWIQDPRIDGINQAYTITLNLNGLQNASQEYIAATIYHEVIHAHLPYSALDNADHNIMADRYVKPMAEALTAMFPSMPVQDAYYLAWGGLKDTRVYNVLSQEYKDAVRDTNILYKSYGGRTSASLGHPCN